MVSSSQIPPSLNLRLATVEDLPEIFCIREMVGENRLTRAQLDEMGITESSLKKLMNRNRLRVWCATVASVQEDESSPAYAESMIVGFAMVRPAERDLFALFVRPQWQGRGVGSQLLSCAVDWLLEHTNGSISLLTGLNTAAQHFYAQRGWTVSATHADKTEIVMTYEGNSNISGCSS